MSSNLLLDTNSSSNLEYPATNRLMSTETSEGDSINEHERTSYTSSTHITDALKQSQFTDNQSKDLSTCPYGCCSTPSLPEYLFMNGLLKGEHYDVVIQAFGKKYKLHRLLLDRSPYFNSLFSWSSNTRIGRSSRNQLSSEVLYSENSYHSDSSDSDDELEEQTSYRKVYDLSFDTDDDPSSTSFLNRKKSFELAISRLYGASNLKEEFKIPYEMIEMGQYLAIPDIVCASTDFIVRNMDMYNLAENLRFAINSDFGSASQRIIENGKGILCSNGWEFGPAAWDGIPTTIIAQTVGEDYFFVPTEWDRCIFIIKLIERRLESHSTFENNENESVLPLKGVLNEKIHYCHMSPDKLQQLENFKDINGDNYIEPHVLHTALWQAVKLETMVTRAVNKPNLDSIECASTPPSKNHKWFRIPTKDETLSGLPKELDYLLRQSLSTTINHGIDTEKKSTQGQRSTINGSERVYNWTKIPPFRFSISFANVSELEVDKRVYGKTFWYAGSYWNLYLQKSYIASKSSYQIGVYLHRAHSGSTNANTKSGLVNPEIFSNNVNYTSLPKKYNNRNREVSFMDTYTPINNDMTQGSVSESVMENLGTDLDELSLSSERSSHTDSPSLSKKSRSQSVINYEDHRNAIKVYFIIFTPSRRSAPTITSFLSVPNDFSKSQSWGWKSNNMCVFKEDGKFADGQDPNLKFMILLGNI
ncbi:hypothetical protein CANINC_001054 [Pichia inconspicua]|uniref:BTB domain-containing protein n=1 Tax=Pichia inconspicua TaxID=52247 RepID=A0A4T0X5T5_9ASCO|nr:hypothetical protein CANINC_001054 [[Candida] inconspicua]